MSDVDTSIYSKFAPPPQPNPLDTAAKMIGLQGGIQDVQKGALNNQLLGLQVRGKQALGQIIGKNTDPKGNVNWDAVSAQASGDPSAAILLPDLQKQVLDRKLSELQVQGADLKLAGDRWSKIGDLAGSLLSQKEPLTRPQVIKSISDNLVGSGMFNDEHSVGQLTDFVKNLPDDDQGLRKVLNGVSLQSNLTKERIDALYAAQHGGLGPSEATAPTPAMVRNPDGTLTPSAITREQFVNTSGQGPVATGAPLSSIGRSGSETAGLVDVYDPDKKQMVKKPSGEIVGDALPRAAGAGAVAASPALGEQTNAEANVHQAQALQQRAAIVPQRKAALANMVNTLDNFQPGPKADLTYQLNGLAQQFGLAAPSVTKGVAAQEEFNKLAAQIALDQWGTLGGTGSNEQLATTVKANPHETLSKMGIKNVAALLQGNEDAIGAQFDAWQKYSAKHGPSSYGDFIQGWNRYYDPRVFQAEHMTPGAVKEMEGKMKPAELKTFQRNQAIARQAGWIGGQ